MSDLPRFKPRRAYWEDKPDGMMESDTDFLGNNRELAVKLLEDYGTKERLQSYASSHYFGWVIDDTDKMIKFVTVRLHRSKKLVLEIDENGNPVGDSFKRDKFYDTMQEAQIRLNCKFSGGLKHGKRI